MSKSRNACMLGSHNNRNAYDWWWHSFSAENLKTGELESFFIEYYVVNPGRGGEKPLFGQIPGKQGRPSYAMIKAGKWGSGKSQINNFWGSSEFKGNNKIMDVAIGPNRASETALQGSVSLSSEEAEAHPEYMSDPGEMSWDLQAEKDISFSVGYGASLPFRAAKLFAMYWHVEGMKTRYSGRVTYNGQEYRVRPETSFGYQDKNWGRDYTNPWIWLNCNCFRDGDGRLLENTSLDIGGGCPVVLGVPIGGKVLGAFCHEGEMHVFNFAKIFFQKQKWTCTVHDDRIEWEIRVSNRTHCLELSFSCLKESMIRINYENPRGERNHKDLWNGGEASGVAVLSERKSGREV
ncbi:MAG: tocopherol cyclase family protein, partial [Spirochaetales bacterium]|nr:tocopherol cyclase family protein [Spirochaetales bacterium]